MCEILNVQLHQLTLLASMGLPLLLFSVTPRYLPNFIFCGRRKEGKADEDRPQNKSPTTAVYTVYTDRTLYKATHGYTVYENLLEHMGYHTEVFTHYTFKYPTTVFSFLSSVRHKMSRFMRTERVPLHNVTFPEGVAPCPRCNLEKYVIRLQTVIQERMSFLEAKFQSDTRLDS
jgi:hypothetical protein